MDMDNTKSRNQIDMLHGPLLMKIIVFTLPLAASSILQQLFNSVDVAVVGRFASSQALAAVGSNTPVISLLINLFMGVSMGANVIISGGMGGGAVDIFNEKNIEVITGAQGKAEDLVDRYLLGELKSTGSVCHEHQHHDECGE